jgi:hypothetical protein
MLAQRGQDFVDPGTRSALASIGGLVAGRGVGAGACRAGVTTAAAMATNTSAIVAAGLNPCMFDSLSKPTGCLVTGS